jgi:hypothetical protein
MTPLVRSPATKWKGLRSTAPLPLLPGPTHHSDKGEALARTVDAAGVLGRRERYTRRNDALPSTRRPNIDPAARRGI